MTDEERKTGDKHIREMLRSLLAKRLALAAHNETRDQNAYALLFHWCWQAGWLPAVCEVFLR
jgi:uncharacterized protein (TIGR03435 family)